MPIFEEVKFIKRSLRKRILSYLGAALGLVVGLAWNDAIRALIDYLFPTSQGTLIAKFIYALGLTLSLGIILIYLEKIMNAEDKEKS